jgi:hypothetical protein
VLYAAIPLGLALVCLWLGRRLMVLVLIFAYLAVEGTLKLLSNSNPIVHVGIDVIVLTVAVFWVMEAIATHRARLPELPWLRLLALYVVWVLALVFHPLSAGLFVSLAAFKMHLTMIPLYLITASLIRTRRDAGRLLVALTAIALVPFAAALLQYALGPASLLDLSPRFWARISTFHEWRPFGTSNVPGGAAVFALLAAPLAITLLRAPGATRRTRVLAVVAIAGASATFAVSGVRQLVVGVLLALMVMGAISLGRGRGRFAATLLLVVVLFAGGYVAVTELLRPIAREAVIADPRSLEIWREQDVTERLQTLMRLGTLTGARAGAAGRVWFRITHYPFGAGLGRTGPVSGNLIERLTADPQSARIESEVGWSDNYFADMISETGLPGVIMIVTILVGLMVGAARLGARARDPFTGDVAAAIAGVLFSYLVMSWGSQPLMTNPTTAYFWMYAGMYAALRRIEAEPEEVPAVIEEAEAGVAVAS